MKKLFDTEIKSNVQVAENIFRLEILSQELSEIVKAGQFVQVKLSDEFTLRRPLGIASAKNGVVKIFYRLVGRGTKFLSTKKVGEHLNILGALGNGFNTNVSGKILLVGGGMGIAPLLSVAEKIPAVDILMGGKNATEINFWIKEFKNEVGKIHITTDDGSRGSKGFVTTLLPEVLEYENYAAIYTCGPEIMMRGVAQIAVENNLPCYVSFERRMACGLGACLSCSIDTSNGRKKVCKDGPVFNAEEVFPLKPKKIESNFSFLKDKPEFKIFASDCIEAEIVFERSPNSCVKLVRTAMEACVKWLYDNDKKFFTNTNNEDKLFVLMSSSSFAVAVGKNLLKKIHHCRISGNKAIHNEKDFSFEEGIRCLSNLFDFVQWIDKNYGKNYQPRTFEVEKIPL
mgnify:FL=1